MTADPRALDWWRLFHRFKASVLWLTAARSFAEGRSKEMVLIMSGLQGGHFHPQRKSSRWMEARGVMA